MDLTTHLPTRTIAAACGAVVLFLGATACGGADDPPDARTGEQGGPQDEQGGPTGRMPGADGKVAAVDGRTAQVQGADGQVAVTWTAATSFTTEVAGTLADVKVGTCVAVGSDDQPSGSTANSTVAARTVRIIARTNGSCAPSMRGPGAPDGSGPQTNGAPPPGAGEDGARPQLRIGGAVGEVTAVSATGFTVESVLPGKDAAGTSAVTVTVGADTAYTKTARGRASDVEVGVCVTAMGTTDDTGAVTARTIAVSQPRDGQCGGPVRFRSDDGGATTQES